MVTKVHDLVVVGGGTAGIIAAKTAAGLGARVALVERDRTGGDCLWTGCVPSKALIAAAHTAHRMRTAARFGITPVEPDVDFAAVMAHVHAAIARIEPVDSPAALSAAGVAVSHADAVFTGPHELRVDGRAVPFRRALVATGSTPALPPVPGLAEVDPLTSDTVWQLVELPARLAVVGGGAVGCELGQAFARLGSEVTVVEVADRLVPAEEPAASAALAAALAAEGVRVRTSTTLTRAKAGADGVELAVSGPGGDDVVTADRVLVATGRRPATTGLGLAAAGIDVDEHGNVVVDAKLRTGNRHVYAAGDVTGALPFTHVAGMHGSIAATNAVLAPVRRIDHGRIPWVTFTDPEIARIGLTEAQAAQRHAGARVRLVEHDEVDRAITDADTGGFTKVVLDRGGRVLGATIVAPRAGEMIAELTTVVARVAKLRDLASAVHAYPTWADGVWHAAIAESTHAMRVPGTRRAIDVVRRLRRTTTRS